MIVKAIYENNVLKPLEKLDLKDGAEVEIEIIEEIIESNADRIAGLLTGIEMNSVDLQHAARDILVKKIISD